MSHYVFEYKTPEIFSLLPSQSALLSTIAETSANKPGCIAMGSIDQTSGANAGSADWQIKVAHKQQECQHAIPREWKVSQPILDLLKFPLDQNPNRIVDFGLIRKAGI